MHDALEAEATSRGHVPGAIDGIARQRPPPCGEIGCAARDGNHAADQ